MYMYIIVTVDMHAQALEYLYLLWLSLLIFIDYCRSWLKFLQVHYIFRMELIIIITLIFRMEQK